MGADLTGSDKDRIAVAGQPDGQIRLNRLRIDAHLNELAGAVRQCDRLAAPEFLNDGDSLGHDFVPG